MLITLNVQSSALPTSAEPITVNVTLGPAGDPQAVYFDASFESAGFTTTSTTGGYDAEYDPPFHEIELYWDLDFYNTEASETFSAPAALSAYPQFFSRKYGRGQFEAAVYRVPGSKTVSVMGYEPSTGKIRYGSATFTIDDANTYFSGNRTVLLNPPGDSDFTWGSSFTGAQQYTIGTVFADGQAAWDDNAPGGTNNPSSEPRRFYIKPGVSNFPMQFNNLDTSTIPPDCLVTSDPANRPSVTWTGRLVDFDDFDTFTWMRFANFTVPSSFDAGVHDPMTYATGPTKFANMSTEVGLLVHNVDCSALASQFINFATTTSLKTIIHIDDVTIDGFGGGEYSTLIGEMSHPESMVIYAGFSAVRDPDTPYAAAAQFDGAIRINGCKKILLKSSNFFQVSDNQQCVKLQENKFSGHTNVHSSRFEGAQNGASRSGIASGDSVISNQIWDNCVLQNVLQRGMLNSRLPGMTVRNCIFQWPTLDAGNVNDGGRAPFEFARDGTTLAVDAAPINVYNNTVATRRTTAQNGSVGSIAWTFGSNPWTATTFENNVWHWPNLSTPEDDGALDETTVLCTSRHEGLRATIGGAYSTATASGLETYRTFKPDKVAGTSPALGGAVSGKVSGFPFGVRGYNAKEILIRTGQTSGSKDAGAYQVSGV